MSNVSVTFGPAQTFPATFTQLPTNTGTFPPQVTIYSDSARTIVAVATANLTATANPNVWLAAVPANLGIAIYYLKFAASYNGTSYTTDSNDTLTVVAAVVGVGTGSLAQVSDVRTGSSDVGTSPLARLWTSLSDAQLLTHLTRASVRAEGIVGSRLVPFTATETVRFSPSADITTYPTPILEWLGNVSQVPPAYPNLWTGTVSSIVAYDPTTNAPVTFDLTGMLFNATTGRVLLRQVSLYQNTTAEVTYTGGYSTVPPDLIEATILLAADAYLVGTDARNGQPDAADLYARATSILHNWTQQVIPGFA